MYDTDNDPIRDGISRTLEHLRQRWAETDREVLRCVFPLLADGPVSVEALSRAGGFAAARSSRAAKSSRVTLDDADAVSGLFGITLQPGPYRIQGTRATLFACCALVAHTAPFLLGKSLSVETQDPVTGNAITLHLSTGDAPAAKPPESAATLVVTDPVEMAKDIGSHFCTHVRHFESMASASQFIARDTRRYLVGLEGMHDAAGRLVAMIWS